jgi:hypothetical protein
MAKKQKCPLCQKSIGLNSYTLAFRPHGPRSNRCASSYLTIVDVQQLLPSPKTLGQPSRPEDI